MKIKFGQCVGKYPKGEMIFVPKIYSWLDRKGNK